MSRDFRRFYVDAVFTGPNTTVRLTVPETLHLHKVLRLKQGETCRVFNREGQGADAMIESISEETGAVLRLTRIFPLANGSLQIQVAQAFPQRGIMDDLVRKAEELGVQKIWVTETAKSMVRVKGEAGEKIRRRWERIVIEAAKQSGTPTLLQIAGPLPLKEVLEKQAGSADHSFLLHPEPEGMTFQEMVREIESSKEAKTRTVFLLLGPEGGLAEEEVKLAEAHGLRKVFLGGSILRVDTAFLGVLSALRFIFS